MDDLRNFWIRDPDACHSNQDGVQKSTTLVISGLSESCLPIGLIDFTARLAYETAGVTMPKFTTDESGISWKFQLELKNTDHVHCQMLFLEKTVKVVARSETCVSRFLRWFAASWPQTFNDYYINDPIIVIEYAYNRYRVMDCFGTLSHWSMIKEQMSQPPQPFQPTFQGLSDLWTSDCFSYEGQSNPDNKCIVGFDFDGPPTQRMLEKSCQLSAQIGLHASELQFPLTHLTYPAKIMFIVKTNGPELETTMNWQIRGPMNTVEILIEGPEQGVANTLDYIASANKPIEDRVSSDLKLDRDPDKQINLE